MADPTARFLLRLPDDLARRFRRAVPARQRGTFVGALIERAPPPDEEDPLHRAARAVEADERLAAEMAEWEVAALGDGLPPSGPEDDLARGFEHLDQPPPRPPGAGR